MTQTTFYDYVKHTKYVFLHVSKWYPFPLKLTYLFVSFSNRHNRSRAFKNEYVLIMPKQFQYEVVVILNYEQFVQIYINQMLACNKINYFLEHQS